MVESTRNSIRRRYQEEINSSELLRTYKRKSIVPLDEELLNAIKATGLVIAGGPGTGKSNVAKIISAQLINAPDIQVKITDSCQNWMHEFELIHYQHINDYTEVPEDVYFGDKSFLYDLEFTDYEKIQETIGMMISTDFELQRLFKKKHVMTNWVIWVIEEAQNVIGSYALTGKRGKKWLTLISEGRNFNLRFIFIGQRLGDISAKAVERCQGFLMGKMTGENDRKKINGMPGAKSFDLGDAVADLELGQFIYWDGVEPVLLDVPKYAVKTKPILWSGGMGI